MIVRGSPEDVAQNRTGQLSDEQRRRLGGLRPFKLAVIPSVFIGLALAAYGVIRQDTLGWVTLGLGVVMLFSALARYRQQQALKKGTVRSLVGLLEGTKPVPLAMFESEIMLDGQSYVLLANMGATPLHPGERYRIFVLDGLARMAVIVAMEAV